MSIQILCVGEPGTTVLLQLNVRCAFLSVETYTIVAACIMFFAIFFLWHTPILRDVIAGFKLFTVATHELFHIIVGMIVGGEVLSICIASFRNQIEDESQVDG